LKDPLTGSMTGWEFLFANEFMVFGFNESSGLFIR